MLKRLHHFLFGHAYGCVSATYCGGTGRLTGRCDVDFCEAWGFTQLLYICDCGKVHKWRVVGDHRVVKETRADSEVNQLRKMAGL